MYVYSVLLQGIKLLDKSKDILKQSYYHIKNGLLCSKNAINMMKNVLLSPA